MSWSGSESAHAVLPRRRRAGWCASASTALVFMGAVCVILVTGSSAGEDPAPAAMSQHVVFEKLYRVEI